MIFKNEDDTYTVKCDTCGKEIKYCPSIQLAMECLFDDGWILDIKDKKTICPKCLKKGK